MANKYIIFVNLVILYEGIQNTMQKNLSLRNQNQNLSQNYCPSTFNLTNNQQQKYLKPQDVYSLIKYFSLMIQQRLQEIQKSNSIYTCLNSFSSQKSDIQNYLIRRYDQYQTADLVEIKLLDRLCQRIIQMFSFYRQKCYQPDTFIHTQEKIQLKLRQLMQTSKSYQIFPNARPKTQKIHANMKQYRNNRSSQENDQTLFMRASNNESTNLNDLILNEGTVNIQKSKQKKNNVKSVEVGTLFKYIFTILKKGYLLRLKLDKRKQPGSNSQNYFWNSNSNTKNINENKIHIQGTQALIRAASSNQNSKAKNIFQKSIQSQQKSIFQVIDINRQKTSVSQFSKKYNKNFIFGNTYNRLAKQKQSEKIPNTKQIQKCLNHLYLDVLIDVQKYSLLRQAKNQEQFLKQSLKRNQFPINQLKKYSQSYNKKYPSFGLIQSCQNKSKQFQIISKNSTNKLKTQQNIYPIQLEEEYVLQREKKYSKVLDEQQQVKIQSQLQLFVEQQNDLIVFLKQQNKLNRLSCLQKSNEIKRTALKNNLNRMNINQRQNMNKTINFNRKNNQKKFSTLNNCKKTQLNSNNEKISKINSQNSYVFPINSQKIQMIDHKVDLYFPLPLQQNSQGVIQNQKQVEKVLKMMLTSKEKFINSCKIKQKNKFRRKHLETKQKTTFYVNHTQKSFELQQEKEYQQICKKGQIFQIILSQKTSNKKIQKLGHSENEQQANQKENIFSKIKDKKLREKSIRIREKENKDKKKSLKNSCKQKNNELSYASHLNYRSGKIINLDLQAN